MVGRLTLRHTRMTGYLGQHIIRGHGYRHLFIVSQNNILLDIY